MLVQYLKLTFIDTKSHRFPHAVIRETSVKGRCWFAYKRRPKGPILGANRVFFSVEKGHQKKTRGRMHFLGTGPKFENVPKFQSNVCWLVKIVHFFTSYWLVAWWNVYVGYRIGILNMTKSFKLTVVSKFEPPFFVTYSWKSWAVT